VVAVIFQFFRPTLDRKLYESVEAATIDDIDDVVVTAAASGADDRLVMGPKRK
jgi:hypothetical protein